MFVIAVAAAAYTAPRIHRHYIPRDALRCAAASDPRERERCFTQRFEGVAREGRIEREFEVLREMAATGWLPDCHVPTHLLGTVAFRALGSRALQLEGMSVCGSGYVHAVAMAAVPASLDSGLTLSAALHKLCGSHPRGSQQRAICTHGAGHGAFVAANQSFASATELCGSLSTDDDRTRCIGGSAMQNSMRYLELDSARYAAIAPYACPDSIPEQRICHEQIGEIALFYYDHDPERARAVCANVPTAQGRGWCEEGITRMSGFRGKPATGHWHMRLGIRLNPDPPVHTAAMRHAH